MAAAIIRCLECEKTFKGREDLKGKRIRCPHCGASFVVGQFVKPDDPVPMAKSAKAKPADDDDEEDANPFGMKTIPLKARCPNCANEMESEDAIICLYCGYNTQTRTLGQTKRTIKQTTEGAILWLMPGILSALSIVLLVLLQILYVIGLPAVTRGSESIVWNLLCSEPIYLWLSMMLLGGIWLIGRFAFKRLILEPTPPEEVID
jgi:DNA-directed RNA polymerase subunit RPC12/RpoP